MAEEKEKLKPKEELFCRLYAGAGEHFNNAVRSYGVAYGKDLPTTPTREWTQEEKNKHNVASVDAHRLLRKDKIVKRCEEILMEEFKDDIADKELAWTLKQRKDLSAKMNAIKEYNKLKGRITEKHELTGGRLGLILAEDKKIMKLFDEKNSERKPKTTKETSERKEINSD